MQPRRRETRVQDSLSLRAGWAPIRLGAERNWRFTHFSAKGSCSRRAWCLVKTHGLISGPACRRVSHGRPRRRRTLFFTTYHQPTLFMSDIPNPYVPRSLPPATRYVCTALQCYWRILGQPRRQCVARRIRNIGRMETESPSLFLFPFCPKRLLN